MLTNLLFLLLIVILLTAIYATVSGAPWLPTKKREAERMIELAGIKPGDVVYDLGCGDGRLMAQAIKKFPDAKFVGVEISFLLFLIAKARFLFMPKSRVEILFRDLFKINLEKADVVLIYLLPSCFPRLAGKLKSELRPGSRVVTGVWPIEELKNNLVEKNKPTEKDLSLFLYRM